MGKEGAVKGIVVAKKDATHGHGQTTATRKPAQVTMRRYEIRNLLKGQVIPKKFS